MNTALPNWLFLLHCHAPLTKELPKTLPLTLRAIYGYKSRRFYVGNPRVTPETQLAPRKAAFAQEVGARDVTTRTWSFSKQTPGCCFRAGRCVVCVVGIVLGEHDMTRPGKVWRFISVYTPQVCYALFPASVFVKRGRFSSKNQGYHQKL